MKLEIAAVRIHVETAFMLIGLLRNKFTFLQFFLSIKADNGKCKLTLIFTICSALSYSCSSVIPVEYVSWNPRKQKLWDSQSNAQILASLPKWIFLEILAQVLQGL